MFSLFRRPRLAQLLILGGVLLVSSLNAAAGKPVPSYTTDLTPWGPHGETSLKRVPSEPRFMALQRAERDKVNYCSVGKHLASEVVGTLATVEATVDIWARHDGSARSRPVGELADETFREMVQSAVGNLAGNRVWPKPGWHGRHIAHMYGLHFGYQFWPAYYEPLKDNPLEVADVGIKIMREVHEQFWSLCLERVPTACFEKGPADPERCLSKLIHPREFPAYDVAADIYQEFMVKPNAW